MTKQEFEKRTGLCPSDKEFEEIHAMYMRTHLNKDEFCDDYVLNKDSMILQQVFEKLQRTEIENKTLQKRCKDVAVCFIGLSVRYKDDHIREYAVDMIGEKQVVLHKLNHNIELTEEDRDFIINNL